MTETSTEATAWATLETLTERMHAADAAAEAAINGTDDEYIDAQVAAEKIRDERNAAFYAWEKLRQADHPGQNIYGPNGD